MTDRSEAIARYLAERRQLPRAELLQALIETFPSATGVEIQAAINSRRPVLTLPGFQAKAG
jgi:hypothetical protein